jgi:hypothetical protein
MLKVNNLIYVGLKACAATVFRQKGITEVWQGVKMKKGVHPG